MSARLSSASWGRARFPVGHPAPAGF